MKTIKVPDSCKFLPFYGDLICDRFRFRGHTFIIGLALPDNIEVYKPCYYLYVFDKKSHSYRQLFGSVDISYLSRHLIDTWWKYFN